MSPLESATPIKITAPQPTIHRVIVSPSSSAP